jgi:class 3 adenylate cyclase/tetratricopeptide (TPR) repeat protein
MTEAASRLALSRKTVTAVFADMVGSTQLAERLDPEPLREVLERYFEAMRLIIQRHGGTVDKFVGDAVVATFGVPQVNEDDALRAVRAASEMQRALAELNRDLEPRLGVSLTQRIGINTGDVVAGDLSTEQRLVSGDTMNVAARLQQSARPGEVVLSESTYRLVQAAVTTEALQPRSLKGKSQLTRAYRLLAVRGVTESGPAEQRAPLVGRRVELLRLQEALDRTIREGFCQLVTVFGAPGLGKSRLIQEFLAETGDRTTQLRSRCLPYGEGITFWPLADVIRQAASIQGSDGEAELRKKLLALAGDPTVATLLGAVVGLAGSQPVAEIFWATGRLMERLILAGPLVLVFDDIHWAEPTFLDLIEHITQLLRDRPILIIVAARHDLLERRPEWIDHRETWLQVELDALSELEGRTLLRNLAGQELTDHMVAAIMRAGEGNPLFIEQMLFMLAEEGELSGASSSSIDLQNRIPPTLSALLSARLDRLPQTQRSTIEAASVFGYLFDPAAIPHLSSEDSGDPTEATLTDLVRKQFIQPRAVTDGTRNSFRFRHILIRDAAYQGTLKRRRAVLHRRCADWLQQREAGTVAVDELVGFHLEQAYLYERQLGSPLSQIAELQGQAAECLRKAGLIAWERGDAAASANLLGRSVRLYGKEEPERRKVLSVLGAVLRETGEAAAAAEALSEALDAARAASDRTTEWRARYELLELNELDWPEGTIEEVRQLIPELERLGDEFGLARCWRFLTMIFWLRGQMTASEDACRRAVEHAARAGDHREEVEIVAGLAVAALAGPRPVMDALQVCEDLLVRVQPNRRAQGFVMTNMAQLLAMAGLFTRARRTLAEGGAILREAGIKRWIAAHALAAGFIEAEAGDFIEAERKLREGEERLPNSIQNDRASMAPYLARVLCHQGRYREALEELLLLDDDAPALLDVDTSIYQRGARARALARIGRPDEAERLAHEAVAIGATTDCLALHGDALADLADVLATTGKPEQAVSAAQGALRLYEAKGSKPAAERTKAFLLRVGR